MTSDDATIVAVPLVRKGADKAPDHPTVAPVATPAEVETGRVAIVATPAATAIATPATMPIARSVFVHSTVGSIMCVGVKVYSTVSDIAVVAMVEARIAVITIFFIVVSIWVVWCFFIIEGHFSPLFRLFWGKIGVDLIKKGHPEVSL
jgi:hypothetical protein